MPSLHGILVELGMVEPLRHEEGENDDEHHTAWIASGGNFNPVPGQLYEVSFGRVPLDGEDRIVNARVRIDGIGPDRWTDLDTGQPLDSRLQQLPVHAYRQL
ncbi:hypothetical protein SAMN06265795_11496 [Noviherbaspirillum humi]|uniref:Uncharacterized protein n=1 Tax=Noviherbaspirillum humi TaxID=1688639 RepID=A0A239K0Z7_9BURK|nr:hypothetical protein [Noviherbaspirillum humi]SNT12037.1 hypothetical protein SAMN06265795_11496 [Noviherbaspirillum humi]